MAKQIIVILLLILMPQLEIRLNVEENEVPPCFSLEDDLESIRQNRMEEEIKQVLEVMEEKKQQELKVMEEENQQDKMFEALVMATWRLETGNGTSWLWIENNNAGGIKCGVGYCGYGSKDEGMNALRNLLKKYVARFGYDFEAIRGMYSESNDTELFRQIFNEEKGKIK